MSEWILSLEPERPQNAGLLSPELAAGISRVKGVKQLGFRAGNWLSAEQSSEVLKRACGDSVRAKRDGLPPLFAMFLGTVVDKNLQALFGSATSLNGVRIGGLLASGCLFGWLSWGLGGF
jgi:hypothetical protein